jgi:nicotinamidase-related amidase
MNAIAGAKAAVLVIDVQVGLFCTQPPPLEAAEVIARINAVAGRARAAGLPIIFVQNDGPPGGDWLVPHSAGWQLHPGLDRRPSDLVIRKSSGDAFHQTNLEATLRDRGVLSLVLMGYATEFCIDTTLRNGASKDFEVCLISDAHTTNDAPMLKASIIREYFNWVWGESVSARGIHVVSAAQIQFVNGTVVRDEGSGSAR